MRWLMTGLLLLSAAAASAQALEASLDRATIFAGETVRLTLQLSGEAPREAPDFQALSADFFLGDTSTSKQLNFVNGRREVRTQWSIVLEPRHHGEITIPPLTLGSLATEALTLTVLPRGQQSDGRELFLESTVDEASPYVHAQVLLTVKLFHVDALTEGRLSEPAIADAVVERLGEDRTYSANIGATRYRVLERRYAVFPEKSGPMTVPAAVFRGRVADSRAGFNSIFDRGRRVTASSEAVTLEVQPRPPAFDGALWLPAARFELTESWPEGGETFTVGEPVTRRIRMEARGLLSVQLPELSLPEVDGVKFYPDKAESQSRTDGIWVFGEREQAYAIVPTRAGTLVLPEVRIPWWDTQADRPREAVLPAREVVVRPGATAPPAPLSEPSAAAAGRPVASGPDRTRWRAAALVLAGLWVATLLAWAVERRRRGPVQAGDRAEPAPPRVGARAHRRRLLEACEADDASLAASALLGWAREELGGDSPSLGALARRTASPELAAAVRELDRALYRKGEARWRGDALRRAVERGLALPGGEASAGEQSGDVLPPLYPAR